MNKNWHEMSEQELETELSTSTVNGLSKKSAAAKRRKIGSNIVFRLPHGSFSSYFKDIMGDSSSVILILAVLIASIFENTVVAYIIAGIILLNCFVAIFTYVKAHRVLESMGEYSLPGAKVVRDGHLYLVSMSSLVPGDLICLKAGDIVPADARVIAADSFFVSEKGVTGNTAAVRKSPQHTLADNKKENMFNMLFATSVVLKGSARAIVVETGEDTLVARTENNDLEFEHDSLDVFVMLKKYGSKINMLMLVMVFVIMFLEIVTGLESRGLYEIFLGGMSLAVAAMTEFYTAFGYIVVACGLFGARTYKRKSANDSVILKNIRSIEKLRDINCVIFKKDGVLTERNKSVDALYASGTVYRIKDYDRALDEFAPLVEAAVVTTGLYMHSAASKQTDTRIPTPDEDAIIECAKRYGLYNIELDKKYPLVTHKSAIGSTSYDYTVVKENGRLRAYLRGSARSVIELCSSYSIGSTDIPIDTSIKVDLLSVIGEYEKINTGVLAVASCEITPEELNTGVFALLRRKNMTFFGLVALKAPLFDGCALTIDRLKNAGVKLIINSPGSSSEDLATAKSLGICEDERDVLTERVFESMTDETLRATIHAYSVYMGLKNASLRKIVTTLRENGYNVAYCAGALSDISVLECADIGYAHAELPGQGRKQKQGKLTPDERETSTDALKFKADIIIPATRKRGEGGILAIEKSILTAKLIYKNLMNLFAYMACVQFARLFIVLYSVFTKKNLLSSPQILVGGLIFDFLAVLSIAFSKPHVHTPADYEQAKREMKAMPKFFLRYGLFGVFWAVMTIFVPMIMNACGARIAGVALVSACFVSFSVLQMVTLAEIKRRESIFSPGSFSINPVYVMSCVGVGLVVAICALIPRLGAIMSVVLPGTNALIAIILTVGAVLAMHEIYKKISSKS